MSVLKQKTLNAGTIFCHDNLPILRGINSDSIDLIYLDPPFNKGKKFHAPIGTTAEGADFSDIWTQDDVKNEWHNEINDRYPDLYKYLDAVSVIGSKPAKYYLIYMAVRLIELNRILKPTGNMILHCDPTASHYIKLLLDTIFGHGNFRNEIIWCYRKWTNDAKIFQQNHEVLLVYSKSGKGCTFNKLFDDKTAESKHYTRGYHTNRISGVTQLLVYDKDKAKHKIKEGKYDRIVDRTGKKLTAIPDWWEISVINPRAKERTNYPTQKPIALLERVIKAFSNEGDIVIDPFCGCATTCVAAERLGRKWIGIDVSRKAYDLVKMRLGKEVETLFTKPLFRSDLPQRTDIPHSRRFTADDKNRKYGEQDGKCIGCMVKFDKRHLTNDHIIPKSHGGSSEYSNLQLLCHNCNSIKGDRPMEYLRMRLKSSGMGNAI